MGLTVGRNVAEPRASFFEKGKGFGDFVKGYTEGSMNYIIFLKPLSVTLSEKFVERSPIIV
jgi:hypothetical protein